MNFGGQVYERFGISINCGKSISPSLFINGAKLRDAIKRNLSIDNECSRDILETSLLWFDSSNYKRRFYIWKNIFSLQFKITKRDIINQWREIGWKIYSSRYKIRHIENKSTESIRRVEALIVLTATSLLSINHQILLMLREANVPPAILTITNTRN